MAGSTPSTPGSPSTTSTSASEQDGKPRTTLPDTAITLDMRNTHIPDMSRAPYAAESRAVPSPAVTHSPTSPLTTPVLIQSANTPPADVPRGARPLLGYSLLPVVHEYEHFPCDASDYAAAKDVVNSFGEAMYKTTQAWRTKSFKTMRLSDYAPLVSFTFAMCGHIGATPKPSIIVRGPNKILPRVKRVLDEPHMKNQYAIDVTSGPSFKLYYCVREDPAFRLQWGSSTVSLGGSEQPLSLCGTRMLAGQHTQTPPSSEATVSCLLEIDGEFYALGPAHLFTPKITANFQEHLLAELRQMDEDEDEGDDITFDDDDDGYSDNNHSPPDDLMSEEGSLKSNVTPSPPKVLDDPSSDEGGLEDLVARYPGPKDLQEDITDCDWAVTQVKKPDQQLPNLYLAEGEQVPAFRHIVGVAGELSENDTQPITEKPVHIITSSLTKYGMLLPQIANISGLSGRGHCNVHVVSMNRSDGGDLPSTALFIRWLHPTRINMGDSGALVVDAQTSVAYGHVVATSPRGEAYVVPLHATLRQVKACFDTDNVRLPEPLDMLGRMVLHYVTTEAFAEAEKVILAMISIVKRLRASFSSEGADRLTYWLKNSATRTALLELDFQKETNHARREEWLKLGEDWKMFVAEEDQMCLYVRAEEYSKRRRVGSR